MKTVSKFAASFFALAMTMGLAPVAFAADTGTVKVTVKGVDGTSKAPAGLAVRITAPGGGAGGKPKAEAPAASKVLAADEKPKGAGGGGRGGPAIKEGVTDADGVAELKDVPVGTYQVSVRGKEGQGRAPVTVEAGKTAEVSITLKAAPAKGEKPAAK